MRTPGLSWQRRSLREEDGAYVVEYLGSLVALFAFLLLVVQIVLVFMNAILVNHALGLAATEAAVRGGVDDNVQQMFRSHLPKALKEQDVAAGAGLTSNFAASGNIGPGNEPSANGDMIRIEYRYVQQFGLLKLLGLDASVNMTRSLKVSSQSAKE